MLLRRIGRRVGNPEANTNSVYDCSLLISMFIVLSFPLYLQLKSNLIAFDT